ncbi:ORF83 [White spot syndrome virus]|uniref:ORF83 n=1 Tax=White spot syndrome virus TaxID=342409 RepID=A0A2D3I6T2_9VIRU|nr:ORF83 [White spot syndrome virus]
MNSTLKLFYFFLLEWVPLCGAFGTPPNPFPLLESILLLHFPRAHQNRTCRRTNLHLPFYLFSSI